MCSRGRGRGWPEARDEAGQRPRITGVGRATTGRARGWIRGDVGRSPVRW
ncbi:hypothetical protein EBESD8_8720 [Rhodococcus aetherivorans]|nr:hypothetical protein EBESD8_8720 [Rhodococcus aetherivorans]